MTKDAGANENWAVYSSEFTTVEVRRNQEGRSPRLCIRDPASGNEVLLDPLLLQALTLLTPEGLEELVVLPGAALSDDYGALPGRT